MQRLGKRIKRLKIQHLSSIETWGLTIAQRLFTLADLFDPSTDHVLTKMAKRRMANIMEQSGGISTSDDLFDDNAQFRQTLS